MGLDQYLYGHVYLRGRPDEKSPLFTESAGIIVPDPLPGETAFDQPHVHSVDISLGYWRKAYHLNQAFTHGVDQDEFELDEDLLDRILEACQDVTRRVANADIAQVEAEDEAYYFWPIGEPQFEELRGELAYAWPWHGEWFSPEEDNITGAFIEYCEEAIPVIERAKKWRKDMTIAGHHAWFRYYQSY